MNRSGFLTLALLSGAALALTGCKHEPDPSAVAFDVQMNRLGGRDDARIDHVASRYAPGNVRGADNGAVIPVMVSQDGVAANPLAVRAVMTPQGVKSYDIHRRIDADNPRVFHRYENVNVLEEDAFWRADGDDSPILQGQMQKDSIGNIARQSVRLKREEANLIGEQNREVQALIGKTNDLLAKTEKMAALLSEKEKVQRQLQDSYEKLVQKNRADVDEMDRLKAKCEELTKQVEEAAKKLGSKAARKTTQIDGQ